MRELACIFRDLTDWTFGFGLIWVIDRLTEELIDWIAMFRWKSLKECGNSVVFELGIIIYGRNWVIVSEIYIIENKIYNL